MKHFLSVLGSMALLPAVFLLAALPAAAEESVEFYYALGMEYGLAEAWDECIEAWNKVLALDEEYPGLRENLAGVYYNRGNAY